MDAAPLSCAGVTTDKALKVASIVPTERVAIFGIGGLGHLAVQYARIMGGSVVAVDIEKEKLDRAVSLGADFVVNAAEVDPVDAIQQLGGVDVALVLAASPRVFEQAFASLRRGGRLICIALPAEGTMSIPIFETVLKGTSIIGSIVGTRQDLAEVFALHAAGRTKVIAESRRGKAGRIGCEQTGDRRGAQICEDDTGSSAAKQRSRPTAFIGAGKAGLSLFLVDAEDFISITSAQ